MATYFFDLHQCSGKVLNDTKGTGVEDREKVHAIAVDLARSFMAQEVRDGRLCLSCWIVVTDEQHRHVLTLQFGEAITVAPMHCAHAHGVETRVDRN